MGRRFSEASGIPMSVAKTSAYSILYLIPTFSSFKTIAVAFMFAFDSVPANGVAVFAPTIVSFLRAISTSQVIG